MTLVLFLFLAACDNRSASDEADIAAKPKCHQIASDEQRLLAERFEKVNLGDPMEEVVHLVGPPDFTEPMGNKQGDEINGTMAFYLVSSCGKDKSVTWDDHFVRLLYGRDGRLFAVESFGVDDVPTRSKVSRQ